MFLPKTTVLLAIVSRSTSKRLTDAEKSELDFVPLKTAAGERTALAEELSVELSPTLVVVHETVQCGRPRHGDTSIATLRKKLLKGSSVLTTSLSTSMQRLTHIHTHTLNDTTSLRDLPYRSYQPLMYSGWR